MPSSLNKDFIIIIIGQASFTKQLSKNLGLSSSLIEKFTLIPYHNISSLNLRYFMKLVPVPGDTMYLEAWATFIFNTNSLTCIFR